MEKSAGVLRAQEGSEHTLTHLTHSNLTAESQGLNEPVSRGHCVETCPFAVGPPKQEEPLQLGLS